MPDFKAYVRQNLPPLEVPPARELEIVEELALEFEELYERAIRRGLDPEAAWQEVKETARPWHELGQELLSALGEQRRNGLPPAFGGYGVDAPSPIRRSNMFGRLGDVLLRDLTYGARQLAKSPGFTITAVLMLALGIGANTAIFSLLNAILLRNLPVRQPDQLVFFGKAEQSGTTRFFPHSSTQAFSYPFYREFRQKNEVFSEVAAIQSFLVASHGRVAGGSELERINVELVSGTYFDTLGVNPILGRAFTDAADQTPGAHPLAVASYSWWQNRFAGDRSIAGSAFTIGQTVYTIIGVAPRDFNGMTVGQSPDLWIPLAMQKEISPDRNGLQDNLFRSLHVIGRLKPGISQAQAEANTDLVFRQILRSYIGPDPSQDDLDGIQQARIELTPAATGRSELRKEFAGPLAILMAVVALVLLITCANIANLLLARAAGRQREIAVRMSLGANRWRLVHQLLAESGLLGGAGALIGVGFAWSASRLLLAMVSTGSEPVPIRVTPDAGVLGFAVAVTVLTVFLFGAVPALRATGLDLAMSLKAGRGVISAGMRNQLARGLVVVQVALSLVLVAGAGLFLRSLAKLKDVDVGFDRHNVLRLRVDLPAAGYQRDQRLSGMMRRIEERAGSLPGAVGVSFALSVFDGGGWSQDDVTVPGQPPPENDPHVDLNVVGPAYFDIMRTPIVLGRGLSPQDNEASRKVAVINETMVRTHFAGRSPLGMTFNLGDEAAFQNVEVVGVVKDAKYMELEEEQVPAAFFPHMQYREEFLRYLVVRYAGDSVSVAPSIRKAIADIDPNLPVSDVRTLAQMVDDFTLNRRLVAELSTFFGILAGLLACIGIYGVMSYGTRQRTNEFGIRMALGAQRSGVLWVVLRETLTLGIVGVAIGLILALACGSLVESLLFGVQSTDPIVLSLSMLAVIVVALVAGYVPARRATLIDPSAALRHE
jgi:predicted permease